LINVDHHQTISTNPQKRPKILPFVRSLQYYQIHMPLQQNLTLTVSHAANK